MSSPYRTPQPVDLADLEGRVLLNPPLTDFKNEVVIPAEGKSILYVGEIRGLETSGPVKDYDRISGRAFLSRYDRVEKSEKKFKWFPPRYQIQSVLKDERIWEVHTFDFFIWAGTFRSDYKDSLKRDALKKGINVSDKLLGLVFGPIDAEILGMYQELHRKLTSTTF